MRHRTRKAKPMHKTKQKNVGNKHTVKKMYKCIKKINDKQLTKKQYSNVNKIQKKLSYNARLQAPHVVIKMNKTILKRKKQLPDMTVDIAKLMISKAEKRY